MGVCVGVCVCVCGCVCRGVGLLLAGSNLLAKEKRFAKMNVHYDDMMTGHW